MAAHHKKIKSFSIIVVFLLVAVALSSGCKDKKTETQSNAQPVKISICIGGAPGIPVLLAHEQGLFLKEGLETTLKKYRTATEGFEGLLNGECGMAAISETSVVLKSFERDDFRVVANIASSENSPRMLVDRKSGIKKPSDLKGKRIFVLKGSSNHYFLDMFLLKNGLSSKEVRLLGRKDVSDVSEAFKRRTIDAFCATEVVIHKPMKALGDDALVFEEPGLCMVYFQLVAMDGFIKAKPDIVKRALTSLLKNEQAIKKDPGRAIKTAAGALGINEDVMAGIWGNYQWNVNLGQSMLLSFEHEAQWAIKTAITKKTALPNYLDFIHADTLRSLKPEAVTLVK